MRMRLDIGFEESSDDLGWWHPSENFSTETSLKLGFSSNSLLPGFLTLTAGITEERLLMEKTDGGQ